ncbi:MAG: tetratricopeptide repeat protein, partial [candidate division NC10 bacterium]
MLADRLLKGVLALAVVSLIYSGSPPAAWGIGEADRLWLVGERAFGDRLYTIARRSLERFVKSYPNEARVGEATLLLGSSQFALGEFQPALENFRKAQRLSPPPGRPEEARFWE